MPAAASTAAADLVLPVRHQPEPSPAPQARPAPKAAESSDAPSTARRLVPTELGDTWYALAQTLCREGGITALARELLLQSQLMQQPDSSAETPAPWVLRVEQESLNHEPSRKKLEQALAAHIGHPAQVQVEYGRVVDCPALRQAALRAEKEEQAKQCFGAHPFVQAMIQQFDARIVPGSVGFAEAAPAARTER